MADKEQNDQVALQEQIKALIKATEDTLSAKNEQQLRGIVLELATVQQKIDQFVSKKELEKIAAVEIQITELNNNLKENQKFIDDFIAKQGQKVTEKKDFGTSWNEVIQTQIESKQAEIVNFQTDRTARLSFDLKVGNMLIANVTGDAVQSYNNRVGMVPNQRTNIRDILPTTPSPTGSFVTYRETGTSGAIGVQTEGQSKSQIDYSWTEEKKVSQYISGFAVFSKQLMFAIPFMTTQLPRQLLRDFYKKENDYFYQAMQLAATGDNTTSGAANTMEQILQLIANQEDADFVASYILGKSRLWSQLLATKGTAEYGVPGGVVFDRDGRTIIAGIPFVKASFADSDSLLIWDNDQLERVETETLRVEFSYEDNDNFRKNLVTARIECFEELNVLRPDAIISTTTS